MGWQSTHPERWRLYYVVGPVRGTQAQIVVILAVRQTDRQTDMQIDTVSRLRRDRQTV